MTLLRRRLATWLVLTSLVWMALAPSWRSASLAQLGICSAGSLAAATADPGPMDAGWGGHCPLCHPQLGGMPGPAPSALPWLRQDLAHAQPAAPEGRLLAASRWAWASARAPPRTQEGSS